MTRKTLIIVGVGIKFMSHLTTETKAAIEQAEKVLYLVNEPAIREWIVSRNSSAESLENLYSQNNERKDNYLAIAEYVLENLKQYNVCLIMYGHPTVLAQPSINSAQLAKKNGYEVVVLPGISAEDCLLSDLCIDPGSCGLQSYEATDMLVYGRNIDNSCHLIIWQSYVIGLKSTITDEHRPEKGLKILQETLEAKYSKNHEIYLYEAAQYPIFKPKIQITKLQNLYKSNVGRLTTLYIPPLVINMPDHSMIKKLKDIN